MPEKFDVVVVYLGKEQNPFMMNVMYDPFIRYDLDRDGEWDGKSLPGEKPVGEDACDLSRNLRIFDF